MNKTVDLDLVKKQAETYYENGDFYCSESVVKTIKDAFDLDISDEVVAMASGFPVGIGGSGCTCGAVSGGIMALGMIFGRNTPKDSKVKRAMELSKELHDIFQKRHKCLCCRILTKGMDKSKREHIEQCVAFTGEIAYETARIIQRELNI